MYFKMRYRKNGNVREDLMHFPDGTKQTDAYAYCQQWCNQRSWISQLVAVEFAALNEAPDGQLAVDEQPKPDAKTSKIA